MTDYKKQVETILAKATNSINAIIDKMQEKPELFVICTNKEGKTVQVNTKYESLTRAIQEGDGTFDAVGRAINAARSYSRLHPDKSFEVRGCDDNTCYWKSERV